MLCILLFSNETDSDTFTITVDDDKVICGSVCCTSVVVVNETDSIVITVDHHKVTCGTLCCASCYCQMTADDDKMICGSLCCASCCY